MNNRSSFFRGLAKIDLLVLDDFGLAPLSETTRRDLLEILDDRYDKQSTLITSQLPVEQWHAYLGDPTWLTRSSIASCTTATVSTSPANRCGRSGRRRPPPRPRIDDHYAPIQHSSRPALHWTGMTWAAGPACCETVDRHHVERWTDMRGLPKWRKDPLSRAEHENLSDIQKRVVKALDVPVSEEAPAPARPH